MNATFDWNQRQKGLINAAFHGKEHESGVEGGSQSHFSSETASKWSSSGL